MQFHKWDKTGVLYLGTKDPYSLFRSFVINFSRQAMVVSNVKGEFSSYDTSTFMTRKRFGGVWSKFHQSQYRPMPDTEKRKLLQTAQEKGATVRVSISGHRLDAELMEAKRQLEERGRGRNKNVVF